MRVAAYRIPTDAPESDGTLEWDSTTLILVEANAGETRGLGYTFAHEAVAHLIAERYVPLVRGHDAFGVSERWSAMQHASRNLGGAGLVAMGIAAVDCSLWDLKARLLALPLVSLLGAVHTSVPAYGSGGFTSYSDERLQEQLGQWVADGLTMVKMKVGRDARRDEHRVRLARSAIGSDAALFVDANGAYSRKQALAQAERFADYDVVWFEEPVVSEDLEGLRFLRDEAPAGMDITAGEYGFELSYFRRMLEAGAVDVLQPDATRCAGITGFLRAAALCEAFGVPLSAHTAPSLHTPLCCAIDGAVHVEYFHDHGRIEQMVFDGALVPAEGDLSPDLSRPGLGLDFKRADAEPFLVWRSTS